MKIIFLLLTFISSFVYSKQRDEEVYRDLYDIIFNTMTMVTQERFKTIDLIKEEFKKKPVEGDIAEVGVWKGGMSIYMAYAFPKRKLWVLDSFQGFEKLDNCKYDPRGILNERHSNGIWIASLESVKSNFETCGLVEDELLEFLPGWVNDTTDPATCPIEKLAILRIDVDAYSATLVTLENLYDKVVSGGYIIFDDTILYETQMAIQEFERKTGIEIAKNLMTPDLKPLGRMEPIAGLVYKKP